MTRRPNGEPESSDNNDTVDVDSFTSAIQAAMGTLETKLTEYLSTNVAPLISRVQELETKLSQGNSATEDKAPSSIEARLAQLEKEKAEALAEQKRNESEKRLRDAISEAIGTVPNVEDADFLRDTLYNKLQSEAEDTQSGWLLKGTGRTPQEYVTDFLQKPTGKRFIRVDTVPGSGTPEPKHAPKTSAASDINSVITNTIW